MCFSLNTGADINTAKSKITGLSDNKQNFLRSMSSSSVPPLFLVPLRTWKRESLDQFTVALFLCLTPWRATAELSSRRDVPHKQCIAPWYSSLSSSMVPRLHSRHHDCHRRGSTPRHGGVANIGSFSCRSHEPAWNIPHLANHVAQASKDASSRCEICHCLLRRMCVQHRCHIVCSKI